MGSFVKILKYILFYLNSKSYNLIWRRISNSLKKLVNLPYDIFKITTKRFVENASYFNITVYYINYSGLGNYTFELTKLLNQEILIKK